MWIKYLDRNSPDSGVAEYEIIDGGTGILLRFRSGDRPVYRYGASDGSGHIREMIRLAQAGDGLNAYINKNGIKGIKER